MLSGMDRPDLIFKALGDPTRLRILQAISRPQETCCSTADQVCACDLEPLLGLAQPTISHHMKILTEAGLIQARKSGRWVSYRLDRSRFQERMLQRFLTQPQQAAREDVDYLLQRLDELAAHTRTAARREPVRAA